MFGGDLSNKLPACIMLDYDLLLEPCAKRWQQPAESPMNRFPNIRLRMKPPKLNYSTTSFPATYLFDDSGFRCDWELLVPRSCTIQNGPAERGEDRLAVSCPPRVKSWELPTRRKDSHN